MSATNITNVTVLDNPALFLVPFQFEISYECNTPFKDDLEWKLIYVGSAEDETYDHANTFTRQSGQPLHQITAKDDVSETCSWNWSIFPTGFLLPNEVLTRHPSWAGHIPDEVHESETPEDKVVEILSRLSPKSLMRFKCVHKSWCTIINSPSFVAKHLSNTVDNKFSSFTRILFNRCQVHVFPDRSWKRDVFWSMINLSIDSDEHNLHYDVEDRNIPFPIEVQDNVQLYGYCNGIVCVIVGENVLLCNPATREFKQLPDSSLLLPLPTGKFGLETLFKGLGFGYDCKTKEYKVVRIIENCDCEYSDGKESYIERILLPYTAEVYTTAANSWKEIKIDTSSDTDPYCIPYSCSMYLKGFCYWFAYDNGEYIFSFDLGDEMFHRIELPFRGESDFKFCGLFLYNESVASYCSCYEEDCKLVEIWVMDDYDEVKSSWTKLLTVGPFKDIESPLTFWKCDEVLILSSYGKATSYNSSTGNLKYFHIPPIINWMIDYVETIVPVK